ncbi:YajG family lipoprotein [Halomonas binhaiensis]|uniref:Lipoprotein n=1 Tax=Halomonas binhaiensis TaxID=2562282 RepID=A0A5C1NCC9_9GAMM|nr:YajG family lipoprotein [Halomonas binhaiensis]QEM81026.1 hypothetical protein E4T21_05265 [Halomonas binhaiensis]
MLRRMYLTASALAAALLLSACAAPQSLLPEPKRSIPVATAGQGQQVSVIAVDGRSSDVLGTRSGVANSTAEIRVNAHEIVPQLQAEAERAVHDMGFTPTAAPVEGAPSLTLTLKELNYLRGASQVVLPEAQLKGVIEVQAQNGGETYTGKYTSLRNQSYAVAPNKAANTSMVTELLSDALNRAFSDPALGQMLGK